MDLFFPKIPRSDPENVIIGDDFDLMKRFPICDNFVGYDQVRKNKLMF
jgi:hypothetical protein